MQSNIFSLFSSLLTANLFFFWQDLKVLLKQYGESCSGNKGELVARLQPFVQEDEGHSKFMRKGNATWSITTRALSTAAASGKVGGGKPGRRQVKEHATRDAAQKYADKQIKDKKKDGYATADEDDDEEEEDDDDDDDDDDTAAGAPPAKKARTVAAASGDVDPASGLAGTGVVHKDVSVMAKIPPRIHPPGLRFHPFSGQGRPV
jgi:predicted DNA-binding WGR domain protein